MPIFIKLIIVVILILLNGFFVASEFALVAVRKTRIHELARKGRKRAKLVKEALKHLDIYISATQLGITLASLGLGWIGEPVLSYLFSPIFQFLPIESRHGVSAVLGFSVITFLHIVIGEISPKTIALQKAEKISLIIIAPLLIFSKIFKPFIWLLNESGNIITKLLGLHKGGSHNIVHSEEEIKMIINQSQKEGVIEKNEVEMVKNVFQLADMPVSKILIPKKKMVTFSIHAPLEKVSQEMERHPFSRFPVYDKNPDYIVGFVHIKDILQAMLDQHIHNDITIDKLNLVRKILIIDSRKKTDDTLNLMRRTHIHLAIVLKKILHKNTIIGLITLEDIIESVLGEIEDEFENEK